MAGDYNAGSIDAALTLDRSEFTRELRQAQKDADDFARRRISPTVDLDTTDARAKLTALARQMQDMRNASLRIALAGYEQARNQLADLARRVNQLDQRRIRLVAVAQTDVATARLRELELRVQALDGRQVNVQADVDIAGAMTQLAALRAEMDRLNRQRVRPGIPGLPGGGGGGGAPRPSGGGAGGGGLLGTLGGGLFTLPGAILALAPLIPPLVTALGGATAAVASFGVAAAGSFGIFAGATMGAIKQSQAHAKAVKQTGLALQAAQKQLAGTTAGTQAYKNALAKVTLAEKAHRKALQDQTAEEKAFNSETGKLTNAWTGFVKSTERYTLTPVITVIQGLRAGLPKLRPLLSELAPLIQDVANGLKRWLSGGGLTRFVAFLKTYGVPIIGNLIIAFRNLLTAGGALLRGFGPIAVKMSEYLARVSWHVKAWGTNGGVDRFKARVFKAWAQLRPIFGALWRAVKSIWDILSGTSAAHSAALTTILQGLSQAIATLRPAVIKSLVEIFQSLGDIATVLAPVLGITTKALVLVINALPPGTIRAIADAMVAWKLAMLGWQAVVGVWRAIATTIDVVRGAWLLLSLAFAASPIGFIITLAVGLISVIVLIATKTTWFQTAWKYTWNAIKTAAKWTWENILRPVFHAIMDALHWVGQKAIWLYDHAIKPAWDAISKAFTWLWGKVSPVLSWIGKAFLAVGKVFWKVYSTIFKVVFILIEAAAKWLWLNVLKPAWHAMNLAWMALMINLRWAWAHILKPVFDAVGKAADWLWTHILKPVWEGTLIGWHTLINGIKAAWQNVLKPVFDKIGKAADWLWRNAIKPAWDNISGKIHTVWRGLVDHVFHPMGTFFTKTIPGWADTLATKLRGAFDNAKKGIADVWGGITKTVGTPIKLVLDRVWNGAIVKTMGEISQYVGHKNPLGTIDTTRIPHFAAGGPVPMLPGAQPGRDSVDARLMPGEHVFTVADVKAMGGQRNVLAFRSLLHGGSPVQGANNSGRFSLGGWVASLADNPFTRAVHRGMSGLKNMVVGAIGTVADPLLDNIKKLIGSLIPGQNGWSRDARGLMGKPLDALKAWIDNRDKRDRASFGSGKGGTIPSGQHLAIITAALQAAGVPRSSWPVWERGLNTLVSRESNWNAHAINLWDSNARAGHPSKGLAQTIDSTYQAYRVRSLPNDIWNPISNLAAAIRYIIATYGGISHVQQAFGATPHGYATGTGGAAPGLAWVGERGPELVRFSGGETVYDHRQSMALAGGALPGYASGTYKVKWGDTLSEIAAQLHTTVAALAHLNHITNVNRIYAGETLRYGATGHRSGHRPHGYATVAKAYAELAEDQKRASKDLAAYHKAESKYNKATTVAAQRAAKAEMDKYGTAYDRTQKEIKADNALIRKNAARYKAADALYREEKKDADTLRTARKKLADTNRSQVMAFLAKSRATLAPQLQAATDARSGYLDAANGLGQLSNLGPGSARTIGQQIAGQKTVLQEFQRDLTRLSQLGLNKAMLRQIAAMGPTQGLTYARSLLQGASKTGISSLNKQYASFEKTATSFADTTADTTYNLSGLKRADKDLAKATVAVSVTTPTKMTLHVDGHTFTAYTEAVAERTVTKVFNAAKRKR